MISCEKGGKKEEKPLPTQMDISVFEGRNNLPRRKKIILRKIGERPYKLVSDLLGEKKSELNSPMSSLI